MTFEVQFPPYLHMQVRLGGVKSRKQLEGKPPPPQIVAPQPTVDVGSPAEKPPSPLELSSFPPPLPSLGRSYPGWVDDGYDYCA